MRKAALLADLAALLLVAANAVAASIGNPDSEPCVPVPRVGGSVPGPEQKFAEDLAQSRGKNYDVVLLGDSITEFWGMTNPDLRIDPTSDGMICMGVGGDRTQHLLYRLKNGALDGYTTKYFTLLIGVNNGFQKRIDENRHCDSAADVAEAIRLMLDLIVAKHPESKVLLMPILPYGFDNRHFDGLEVRAMCEDVNDALVGFVDNRRVFWLDIRGAFLNEDGTCKAELFGGPGGNYDARGHCLHPCGAAYSSVFNPAVRAAMKRHLGVAAGTPQAAEPSLGLATVSQHGLDGAVTVTVSGIFLGTDAKAVPVTSYSVAYELDDGPKTVALENQTRTRNTFVIPNVALGGHVCKVTVTTANGKEVATSVRFTMHDGWTGAALPTDGGAIRTDGELVYAYAPGDCTVNFVPFARARGAISADIDWPYALDSGSPVPPGVAHGGYSDLLTHCWWANAGEKAVTLRNLAPGEKYLVQIVGHRKWDGYDRSRVWIKESCRDASYIKVSGEGWPCGGVLTGIFTATAPTKRITVCSDGNYAVNGIQIRRLTSPRADCYTVLGEQFDVSRVVRGTGTVSVACAALERHLKTVRGKHFFGFGMPVDFAVEIPVGGEAVSFEVTLGPVRGSSAGAVVAKVIGDGRELWTSDAIAFDATNEIPVKVDVTGVKALTLAVDSVGGAKGIAGLVWGEARLVCRKGRVLPNDVRRTSRQLGILTPPERRSPRVNGVRVFGVRPGHPILFRVPVTGVGVKVKVEGEGEGWTFDPVTRVLSGAIEKPGEYRLTIAAMNAFGRDEKPLVLKVGDKIALTPVMGWSSWNCFAETVSAEKVKSAADALVATGLADHGWTYVNIDDFWQGEPGRDASGRLRPSERFPDMKGLVDAIHARGLKAGIYSSPGPKTCGGLVGSWRHEAVDAATFADWSFDYLKYDWCSYNEVATGEGRERAMRPYRMMGELLARQGRDIVFALCQYGMEDVSAWGREVGAQSWRTSGDVFDTWASVSSVFERMRPISRRSGPGAWNDADMLCVGCVRWNEFGRSRLAPNEQYTHLSFWALWAAPLVLGCDLTKLDDFTRSLLTNDEVIEIDQDPLGKGAVPVQSGDGWEIWVRPLVDGSVAAGLYNKSGREQTIAFDLEKAGILCKWRIRDVWRQEDVGVFLGRYESSVPGHATHLIRLSPLPCGKLGKEFYR